MDESQERAGRRQFLQKAVGATAAIALGAPTTIGAAQEGQSTLPTRLPAEIPRDTESLWGAVRKAFPLEEGLTYMNNGGLGPSPYPVIEAVYRRTMALETISETGHSALESMRRKCAAFFGCEREELGFTRSTTEGMNLVARGLPLDEASEILMSTHEHPGGAMPWVALARENGHTVRLFEPGLTAEENIKAIRAAITPKTRVLCLSHVTCTTGLRFPVKEIAGICRDANIVFVVDGAHPPGMMPVNLHDLGCDFYVCSGHKWLLGPKGTGLLYVRRPLLDVWRPVFVGAYSDAVFNLDTREFEHKREASAVEYGTRNVALIEGLVSAIDFLSGIGMERIAARGAAMAHYCKEGLLSLGAVKILTPMDRENSSAIVTFQVLDGRIEPWTLVSRLKKHHNVRLRQVSEHGLNGVRVSLALYNSFEQVDNLVDVLGREIG